MKSKYLVTAILFGCILSVVVTFKVDIIDQARSKDVDHIVNGSTGLQLISERLSYQNDDCFKEFNSKIIFSKLKNETVLCLKISDSQEKFMRASIKEFNSEMAPKREKLLNVCDQEEDSLKYYECYNKVKNQLVEVNSKTVEFLSKFENIIKDKHNCLSKYIDESKVKSTSFLSDLKVCLLQKSLPELNLDNLQVIYKTLRTCVQGGKDDFDKCLKKNMVAINGRKDLLREIAAKYCEEINAFDQKENSCLRHFIAGNIFPDFPFAFDFEKCLKTGFNANVIQVNDNENLAHGFLNLHNALLACRIDLNKTNIEKCIFETLVDSEEAHFIEKRLQRLSEEDLQKSYNKMQEVFINKLNCSGYIFKKLEFRGVFMNGSAKEELNKCIDKYYVSNTKLPTMNDAVNKLKKIEMSLTKCIQYPNGPQLLSYCFAQIIDDSESSLNYVEKYFDELKGLVLNVAEGKRNGISILLELQDNLLRISLPPMPVFDLDKLKSIYKTLRTCASDHLHDFDICWGESVKAVKIIKDRLIEISEKSFKEINTFDQNEDACLRDFIVGMVLNQSNCAHDFLKNCLIHGFKKSRIGEIDDENFVDAYRNLQNRLLECRVDYNETLIENCVSETLLISNEARYIGCNIRTLPEESLQSRSNKINDVLDETHCIRNIFEKIKYHGLFMGGSDKEEFKECIEKYYVSNTEGPTLKDVVNKLKTIETAFINCNQSARDPDCFAEIIAANERSFVYIEINFVQFQGLAIKMLKGKCKGGVSPLEDLQNYLEMNSTLTFDLYELSKMYKSVQTCVKDGKADFSKCMEVTEKLKNRRNRLIKISEKYSEQINKEDLCFRHFITKIVFPDFASDLANCLKNGFNETLFKDNANENLIKELKNLQNELLTCRIEFNTSNIEKCISEKLDNYNGIQTLLLTSSGENLKKLKSQIDEISNTENNCIGYVFETLLFRGLFMNNLTKNNFIICTEKLHVSLQKDVVNKFKTIIISYNECNTFWIDFMFVQCVANVTDANESSLDYIDKHFDKLNNLPLEPNFKCLSEIKSRSPSWFGGRYPDIERCLTNWRYVFEPNHIEIQEKQFNVRYSTVKDIYERYIKDGSNVTVIETYKSWQSAASFYSPKIWRYTKEKAVYLSKYIYDDGDKRDEIVWKFDFSKTNLKVKDFSLRFDNTTRDDAIIEVLVQNAEGSKEVIGSKNLVITAIFQNPGKMRNFSEYKAQLFSQTEDSKEYPFDLNVELCL